MTGLRHLVLLAVAVQVQCGLAALNPAPDADLFLQPHSTSIEGVLQRWNIGGSTEIVDNVVRLTSDRQSQRGYMWSPSPVNHMGEEWEIILEAQIHGRGVSLFGDGLAFFYTADPFEFGNVFGHSDRFKGLAVFFDTYDNAAGKHLHKHPFISAMVNDGTYQVFHDETGTHSALNPDSGCHARIRQFGSDEKVVAVRMTYKDKRLTLKHTYGRVGDYKRKRPYEWTECFVMEDIELPSGYYIGLSASTGDLSDNHDILSFSLTTQKDAVAPPPAPDTPQSEDQEPAPVAQQEPAPVDSAPVAEAETVQQEPPPAPQQQTQQQQQQQQPLPPPPMFAANSVEELNEIVGSSNVITELQTKSSQQSLTVDRIRQENERRVSGLKDHLSDVISQLQAAENRLEARVEQLEQELGSRVNDLEETTVNSSGSWLLPFVGLVCVCVVAIGYVCVQWRSLHRKYHTL